MDEERLKQIDTELARLTEEYNKIQGENCPYFERGIVEASAEKHAIIREDLKKIFVKYNVVPHFSMQIKNDMHEGQLVCPGILVQIQYLVSPTDKQGKGYFTNQEDEKRMEEIQKKMEELDKEAENIRIVVLDKEPDNIKVITS